MICKGFNIKTFKDFLSTKGKNENGKTAWHYAIRKHFYAIFHESKESKEPLPPSFYAEIGSYLIIFKKRAAKAKESGDIDENGSDSIHFSLCNYSCKWIVEENNIFSWAWTVTQ